MQRWTFRLQVSALGPFWFRKFSSGLTLGLIFDETFFSGQKSVRTSRFPKTTLNKLRSGLLDFFGPSFSLMGLLRVWKFGLIFVMPLLQLWKLKRMAEQTVMPNVHDTEGKGGGRQRALKLPLPVPFNTGFRLYFWCLRPFALFFNCEIFPPRLLPPPVHLPPLLSRAPAPPVLFHYTGMNVFFLDRKENFYPVQLPGWTPTAVTRFWRDFGEVWCEWIDRGTIANGMNS